jgi:hypothetical protein
MTKTLPISQNQFLIGVGIMTFVFSLTYLLWIGTSEITLLKIIAVIGVIIPGFFGVWGIIIAIIIFFTNTLPKYLQFKD